MIGINHQTMNYEKVHEMFPDLPLYCSEMVFGLPDLKHTLELEYVLGGYYFTAWPAYADSTGRYYDALGGKGEQYYANKAICLPDEPLVKAWPEWDFPGDEGKVKKIKVMSNADEVELFLNGGSLGKKEVTDFFTFPEYEAAYEPGEMKAVAYRGGMAVAEDVYLTSGEPAAVKLVMENPGLKNNNDDVAIITAYVIDKNGSLCKHATGVEVIFSCNEAGEFMTATSLRRDGWLGLRGPAIRTQDGRCQAFFRSMDKGTDLIIMANAKISITAGASAGAKALAPCELTIKREMTGAIPAVAPEPNPYVTEWQISGAFVHTMDEDEIMNAHAIERWEFIDIQGFSGVLNGLMTSFWFEGRYPEGTSFHFAYHAYATVPDLNDRSGKEGKQGKQEPKLTLFFEGFDGKGNAYVIGSGRRACANQPENAPWPGHYRPELAVDCDIFKPGDKVEIWCFFHDAHRVAGVTWPVRWAYM